MKIFTQTFLGFSLIFSPLLNGENVKVLLGQSIKSSAEEGWEYSANGGYVFEAEMDLIGDDKPENLVWFSVDGYGSIHIFDSSMEQKYLGKLDRRLLGETMVKADEKTTIFSVSEGDNYPSGGEEAFTKKVLSTVISKEGVEKLERIVGVGPGDVEDKQFNALRNDPMRLEGAVNFTPQIRFTSLGSYLNGEDDWRDFRQDEWVEIDSYLVHQDDVDVVRRMKSSSDENEVQTLLGDFTKEKALQLLGSFVNSKSGRAVPRNFERDVRDETETSLRISSNHLHSEQEGTEQTKDPSSLQWIIGGALFLGILALLFKVWKGRSAR